MSPRHPSQARKTAFKVPFALSDEAQLGLLRLPALQTQIAGQRRLVIVETANRLEQSGVRHNRAAAILGLPAITLCYWRKAYRELGFSGLLPRIRRSARQHTAKVPPPCSVVLTLLA